VYAICSFARILEYIPLFWGLYNFFKDHTFDNLWPQGTFARPHRQRRTIGFICSLLPLYALALFTPSLAIASEIIHGKKKLCIDDLSTVYYIYCVLNYFRYLWVLSVRVAMILATLKVKEIWGKVAAEESGYNIPITVLHAKLTKEYMEAGEKVQKIASIFQTWFLFPWIIFFIASSLEGKDILSVWDKDRENVETLPMAYFLLYNINQIIYLLIPYICGQKMNHYHHECHARIQEQQLSLTTTENDLLERRKVLIQEEHDYDFVPRFWGLGFKVHMNSIIYIIFLLLGVAFTIFRSML